MKTFNKIVLSVVLTFQLVVGKADEGMWLPMLLCEEPYKNMVECAKAIKISGADIVTVAVRRVNIVDNKKPLLMDY